MDFLVKRNSICVYPNELDYETLENLCNEQDFQKESFVRELKELTELHKLEIRLVS